MTDRAVYLNKCDILSQFVLIPPRSPGVCRELAEYYDPAAGRLPRKIPLGWPEGST